MMGSQVTSKVDLLPLTGPFIDTLMLFKGNHLQLLLAHWFMIESWYGFIEAYILLKYF